MPDLPRARFVPPPVRLPKHYATAEVDPAAGWDANGSPVDSDDDLVDDPANLLRDSIVRPDGTVPEINREASFAWMNVGHRPPEMACYDPTPTSAQLRAEDARFAKRLVLAFVVAGALTVAWCAWMLGLLGVFR